MTIPTTFVPSTILVSTWGYELTRSSWEGQVVPNPGIINGAPMRRKLGKWNDTLFTKVEHRTYATQWDGKPIRFSSYA